MRSNHFFTSRREGWLWLWLLIILIAVFSTLAVAPSISIALQKYEIFESLFVVGFFLMFASLSAIALKTRPGRLEMGIFLGLVATYLMVFSRMGIVPGRAEERAHLFEYSLVAALIYEIIIERNDNGHPIKFPAFLAFTFATIIGALDELVQYFLPTRFFDMRDIGFNALAALMAVVAISVLRWARKRVNR